MTTETQTSSDACTITKRLLLIRHGVSLANEWMDRDGNRWGDPTFTDDPSLRDAKLSKAGEAQARDMRTRLQREYSDLLAQVELVVVSPLTRTLQTMDIGVRPLLAPTVPILAHHDTRERLYTASDTGRPAHVLRAEYSYVDFALVPPDTWWFQGDMGEEWRPFGDGQTYAVPGEPNELFQDRLREFQKWLASRPERTIVLVSHWAILRAWTGDEFQNCESRLVEWNLL
jgi:broad specificity phosphatase PhoE